MNNLEPDPIFIVGNGRSGTTLMARVLNRHPSVYILNETHYIYEFWALIESNNRDFDPYNIVNRMYAIQKNGIYRKTEYHEYDEETEKIVAIWKRSTDNSFAQLVKCFFSYQAKKHGKIWAGDQTPKHIYFLGRITEQFPNSKIIHMVRDPKAQVLSQKRKWLVSKRYDRPIFEIIRTKINYHPITMAILWKRAIEIGLKADEKLSNQRFKTVFFEELLTSPEEKIKELCNWLGVTYSADLLNVGVRGSSNKNDSDSKMIDPNIIQNWKNYMSRTEMFIVQWITKSYMKRLGYKKDVIWPNPLMLLFYILIWPAQLIIAFCMNTSRMGNPIVFLQQRLISIK